MSDLFLVAMCAVMCVENACIIIIIIFPLRDRRWAQQKFSVTYQEVRLWGGYVDG